jgi:hypothetical protein
MRSTKQQARVAGLLYLVLALSAPFGLVYAPGKLFVSGDAAATAANIRAHEWILRVGIASELFHQVICVFLVLAFYRLFKAVDEGLAKQVVIFGALVSVPIVFVNVLTEIAALLLLSGADFLAVFDKQELEALAYLFVRLHGEGIGVVSVFWGIWLFPLGLLAIRSGFIPRALGVLLMIAGAAYLVAEITTLLAPAYEKLVGQIAMPLELGELPIVVWLLIWGARPAPSLNEA